MKQFAVTNRSSTTGLKQPKELFSYSRNLDASWNLDEEVSKKEALAYYYFPDSQLDNNINLSGGFQTFQKIPDAANVANFPSLLRCLQNHEQETGKKVKVDIITFRGIMSKLITLIYDDRNPVELYVIAYDKQLFLKNDDEADAKRKEEQKNKAAENEKDALYLQQCEFVGYKFETLTTLPKPWAECTRPMIEKRTKKVVNNYEQYLSVVRSGIGKIKTLLAGEVDGVWDYVPEKGEDILPHYVELKTSAVVETPPQMVRFELKLFKTWAQCFLLGIKQFVYGYRDQNFNLRGVEVFQTEEVPVILKESDVSRRGVPQYSCTEALKWYGALLDWLVLSIDLTDELKAYKLTYNAVSKQVILKECSKEENDILRNGDILTDEFKQWRNSIRK